MYWSWAQVAKHPVVWVATHLREAGGGRWATPAEAVLPDPQSRQQPELTGGLPCPDTETTLCNCRYSAWKRAYIVPAARPIVSS